MGRNCIEEIVQHSPERLEEVYLASAAEDSGRVVDRRSALLEQIQSLGVKVIQRTRRELDQLVSSDSHQGIVARVSPRRMLEAEDLLELLRSSRFTRVLALDGVIDPQNFGALLRAAECFGVDAVVWSKNRAAPLGPVVSKVSVGASELVPLCVVSNLHRVLEQMKQSGAWLVGAVMAADATSLDSFEFPERCVLVMGSEAEGIQQLIERSLDFKVTIPMSGEISSLNVSQASAVMLSELARQHRRMDKAASLK
jgi:23S rRNA (guanosine2251-2'-O)-methyltransferase